MDYARPSVLCLPPSLLDSAFTKQECRRFWVPGTVLGARHATGNLSPCLHGACYSRKEMDNKQERTNMNRITSAGGKSYKDDKLRVVTAEASVSGLEKAL